MKNKRDELQSKYEDARLALLMDEFCEQEGAKLLAERDTLNGDPAAAIPETLHQRLQKTADRHFAAEERARKRPAVRHVLKHVLLAVAITAVMFTTAFATVEDFRVGILNFSLKMQEKYSTLDFEWTSDKSNQGTDQTGTASQNVVQFGNGRIVVDFDLTEFTVLENTSYTSGVDVFLKNETTGNVIAIHSTKIVSGMDFRVDTENADMVSDIEIGGNSGYLIMKGDRTHIVWADFQNSMTLEVITKGLSEDFTLALAESITYVDEK